MASRRVVAPPAARAYRTAGRPLPAYTGRTTRVALPRSGHADKARDARVPVTRLGTPISEVRSAFIRLMLHIHIHPHSHVHTFFAHRSSHNTLSAQTSCVTRQHLLAVRLRVLPRLRPALRVSADQPQDSEGLAAGCQPAPSWPAGRKHIIRNPQTLVNRHQRSADPGNPQESADPGNPSSGSADPGNRRTCLQEGNPTPRKPHPPLTIPDITLHRHLRA